jgi:hypothetical protein
MKNTLVGTVEALTMAVMKNTVFFSRSSVFALVGLRFSDKMTGRMQDGKG